MTEETQKTQEKDDVAQPATAPETAVPELGLDEIKACVGATGGGDGEGAAPQPGSAIPPEELERLKNDLIAALKTVYDPEIPVDIYELGLIYRLEVDDDRNIEVDMTLTAPGCPVAGEMPGWVENAVASVPGVGQVKVKLTFDPPWDMSRMSEPSRDLPHLEAMTIQTRPQVMRLTEAAAERLRALQAASGNDVAGVRIGVKNGGCAGMEYTLSYVNERGPHDELVEEKGVKLLIDPTAVMFLLGTEMDYRTDQMRSGFVFNNPNQTSACGCGESVSLKPADTARDHPEASE